MSTIKNVPLLLLEVVLTTCSLADHHPPKGPPGQRPPSVVEVDGKKPPVGPKPPPKHKPPTPAGIEVEADKHPVAQKPPRGPIKPPPMQSHQLPKGLKWKMAKSLLRDQSHLQATAKFKLMGKLFLELSCLK
ncbi:hypothetical protein NMG60_11031979 [Bertholletia excelsa]